MSRLYYPPIAGSRLATGTANTKEKISDVLEKVAKIIPAELLTGYSGLISVCSDFHSATTRYVTYGISFLACWIATPIYLNKMADAGKPRVIHLIQSTIAFAVWAYFTSAKQIIPQYFSTAGATFALLLFSVLSGAIPVRR